MQNICVKTWISCACKAVSRLPRLNSHMGGVTISYVFSLKKPTTLRCSVRLIRTCNRCCTFASTLYTFLNVSILFRGAFIHVLSVQFAFFHNVSFYLTLFVLMCLKFISCADFGALLVVCANIINTKHVHKSFILSEFKWIVCMYII